MKLLALDSTTDRISLAVLDDGRVIGERTYQGGRYSESIMPALDGLLAEADVPLRSLDGFAVDTGPGSFTGVRVGIAAAKGIAQALRRPLVGIPALDILARQPLWEGTIIAALDAKRGAAYWASYRMRSHSSGIGREGSDIEQATPTRLSSLSELRREAESVAEVVLLVGTVLLLPEISEWRRPADVQLGGEDEARPQAATLGRLSEPLVSGLGWESLFSVQPVYWRPADALKLAERRARAR